MKTKKKILPLTALFLASAEVALTLFSWFITSVMPSVELRSVLSGEGLRWLFGSFVGNLSSPLSVWLILVFMAYGAYSYSGLKYSVRSLLRGERLGYRHRHAVYTAAVTACVIISVIALLAFMPHAVLLGVSGTLFPGAFSSALVPVIALSVILLSVVYGIASGKLASIYDIYRSMYSGMYVLAPLIPVYALAVQLYCTVQFIFF